MSQGFERIIDDDSAHPRFQRAFAPPGKLVHRLEYLDERLLQDILDIVVIRDVAGANGRKIPCIASVEYLHRGLVLLPDPEYQVLLRPVILDSDSQLSAWSVYD